jgi:hypothetical protein
MQPVNREAMKPLARKYVWWKTPDEAIARPERVVAQVMDIGDWADVRALESAAGQPMLRDVLTNAEAGQFSARSWTFWHYRLGLATIERVPPLPTRQFG